MFKVARASTNLIFEHDSQSYRTIAITAHGDQKYGTHPYCLHLSMVEHSLVNHGYDDFHHRAAAWLHDGLEDTGLTYQFIQKTYGEKVGRMVYACTGVGENRKARNACIYERLKQFPEGAPVKAVDRLVNMTFSAQNNSKKLNMYLDEFPEFYENIKVPLLETRRGSRLLSSLEEVFERGNALTVVSEAKAA